MTASKSSANIGYAVIYVDGRATCITCGMTWVVIHTQQGEIKCPSCDKSECLNPSPESTKEGGKIK